MQQIITNIPQIKFTDTNNYFLIAGPCIIENEEMPFEIAETIKSITDKLQIPYIFKASYRKANRSKYDSFQGIGDIKGLELLKKIKEKYQIPVITDVHTAEEAKIASNYVDIIQIPAFLCRQTDLLVAAGETNKVINIKKGQFVSAQSMKYAAEKVMSTGNKSVILTERGSMFGYNDLIVDFRNIPIMKSFEIPVVVDVTHSLQQPNQSSGVSGGQPELITHIAQAAIAVGADGIFLETHPEPQKAKSDGANMLRLSELELLLTKLNKIRSAII
jgi:2-dehydro-3-deoxyphosphooctonate aldolase (KDO 8-P synthase)